MKQDAPFTLRFEFTEGCNLYCDFCGIKGIRVPNQRHIRNFMTLATCERICQFIPMDWNPRLEIAMRGEPTLNPDLVALLACIRTYFPRGYIMLTSNGGGLLKPGILDEVMRIVNVLALDDYEGANIVPKVIEGRHAYRYPDDGKDFNPYQRTKHDVHRIVVMQDISKCEGGVHNKAWMCNHCGAAAPLNDSQAGKRCARPFRELSISWDGTVLVCCNDWRRELPIANVNEVPSGAVENGMNMEDIWQGSLFTAVRNHLYHGKRGFRPCEGCDAKSMRVGLLPDKKGEDWCAVPSAEDRALIAKAEAVGPLTPPVKRSWE